MQTGLFREEATSHLGGTNAFFGEVPGLPPPSWAKVTWLLSLFMASLATFLFSVSLARSETARGGACASTALRRGYLRLPWHRPCRLRG